MLVSKTRFFYANEVESRQENFLLTLGGKVQYVQYKYSVRKAGIICVPWSEVFVHSKDDFCYYGTSRSKLSESRHSTCTIHGPKSFPNP
jgi:hypothetical protein